MKMVDWFLTSSVLTALVIALRYALPPKISLRLQYALWALVLLRLLIPVNLFPSSLSILNTLERTEAEPLAAEPRPAEPAGLPVLPIAEEIPAAATPAGTADLPKPVAAGEGKAPATAVVPVSAPDKTGFAVNWQKAAWYVWLGGALAVGGWFFGCNLHFCRKLKKTGKPYASQGVRPPVYVTNAAETPCLAGVFRPRIYVTPKVAGNPTQMEHVLNHERTHFYHGDHVWSVLRSI